MITLEGKSGRYSIKELCHNGPLLLLLLRHFGCPLCREQLLVTASVFDQLQQLGISVIGVGQNIGAEAEDYGSSLGLPFPVYGDRDNKLYRELAMPRGSWWQVTFGPMLRQPLKALQRFRYIGKPGKDVQQLGGAALFSQESKLLWCYRQRDSGDVISGDELIIQLTAAIKGSSLN